MTVAIAALGVLAQLSAVDAKIVVNTEPQHAVETLAQPVGSADDARLVALITMALRPFREDITARFDAVDARFDAPDARFDAADARFDARFDATDARFDATEARFDATDARFDALDSAIKTMAESFVWQSDADRVHPCADNATAFIVASFNETHRGSGCAFAVQLGDQVRMSNA